MANINIAQNYGHVVVGDTVHLLGGNTMSVEDFEWHLWRDEEERKARAREVEAAHQQKLAEQNKEHEIEALIAQMTQLTTLVTELLKQQQTN